MKFKTEKVETEQEQTPTPKTLKNVYCDIVKARIALIKESICVIEDALNHICDEEHNCS